MVGTRFHGRSIQPFEAGKCRYPTSSAHVVDRSLKYYNENNDSNPQRLAVSLLYCLPRELRNRIYSFCVQSSYDDEVIVRRANDCTNRIAFFVRDCIGPHSYRWVQDPTMAFIGTHNLGKEVAREMLEAYYWTRTFKFSHRDLFMVKHFLETDQFGSETIPAYYVRRLQIQVQLGSLAPTRSNEMLKPRDKGCLEAIKSLGAMLTTRTAIAINIEAFEEHDDTQWPHLSETPDEISQVVHDLKEKGLQVVVRHSRSWDG